MLNIYCQSDYEVYFDVGLPTVMAPGRDQEARLRCHPFLFALQDCCGIILCAHFVPTFAAGDSAETIWEMGC